MAHTTIQLDTATAGTIASLARNMDISIAEYLRRHFAPHADTARIEVDAWLAELDTLAAAGDDKPPLPPTLSREDIYSDPD